MPSIYQLKPAFQGLLRPLCRGLARLGVSANQVTVLAALLSGVLGGLIVWRPAAAWPLLTMPGFLFARMALNAIDGMLAREHAMQSPLGGILNEVGDLISDAALYLPLALVPGLDPRLVVVGVALALIGEATGVVGVAIGASRRYDGPMGKSDRAFVFGAVCLALGLGAPAAPWADVVLWGVVGLSALTIVNRGRHALRELAASEAAA